MKSFKVGDKVFIKPKEYFDENYKFYSGYYFNKISNIIEVTSSMSKHFGSITKISEIRYLEFNEQRAYYLECDSGGGYWKDTMFELVSDDDDIKNSINKYCNGYCISKCLEKECPLYKYRIV